MEIKFQSKEESNREQREAFLRLEPKDRFYRFLDLCESLKNFPVKLANKAPSDNFIIEIKTHDKIWKENIDAFLREASKEGVKMLLVGGGAVNFHGYQRHSTDVVFWIDTSEENFSKLLQVFRRMGYKIDSFPEKVKNKEQNISVKFSPADLNLELITNFQIGKSFDEAFSESGKVEIKDHGVSKWNVLNLNDLIESKRRAARPKDLLNILELKSIHKLE